MGFRQKLQFQLVKTLSISNKEAKLLIESGRVKINQQTTFLNEVIYPLHEIEVNGKIIQSFLIFIIQHNSTTSFKILLYFKQT